MHILVDVLNTRCLRDNFLVSKRKNDIKHDYIQIHCRRYPCGIVSELGIGVFGEEGRGRRSLTLCFKVARREKKTENMSKLL